MGQQIGGRRVELMSEGHRAQTQREATFKRQPYDPKESANRRRGVGLGAGSGIATPGARRKGASQELGPMDRLSQEDWRALLEPGNAARLAQLQREDQEWQAAQSAGAAASKARATAALQLIAKEVRHMGALGGDTIDGAPWSYMLCREPHASGLLSADTKMADAIKELLDKANETPRARRKANVFENS